MAKRGPIIRKVDANQHDILKKCESVGISTQSIHICGHGCPDAILGFNSFSMVIEIKMPGEKLTPDEVAWHEKWKGQVAIIHSFEEALALFGMSCS
jgi:hypothetical protein